MSDGMDPVTLLLETKKDQVIINWKHTIWDIGHLGTNNA